MCKKIPFILLSCPYKYLKFFWLCVKILCMDFIDLYKLSQTHKVLSQDIRSNMLSHCYLINSKDRVFLSKLCLFAVKELYCMSDSKPCDICVNCQKIEHSNMVDFEIYPKDKSLVVEDILNVVSSAQIRAMESDFKVFLLNNFDECTIQGQNKILKTLEEPPANVIFILSCENMGLVLPTILSRAKKIIESPLSIEIIDKFLSDKKISNSRVIASMSDGLITNALNIAENKEANKIMDLSLSTLTNLKSTKELLDYSSQILALKKDIPFFLDTMIAMLRDISVVNYGGKLLFENLNSEYKKLASIYSSEMIQKITQKINEIAQKQEVNCNMTSVIDTLLLDILEVKFLCQK